MVAWLTGWLFGWLVGWLAAVHVCRMLVSVHILNISNITFILLSSVTKDNQMIMIAITFIIIIIIFYVIIIIVSHYLVSFARTLPRVFQISCATLVSE